MCIICNFVFTHQILKLCFFLPEYSFNYFGKNPQKVVNPENLHTASLEKKSSRQRLECSVCMKTFISFSDLVRHTRIHTGERPFVCNICGHAFHQKCTLKRHLKVHVTKWCKFWLDYCLWKMILFKYCCFKERDA